MKTNQMKINQKGFGVLGLIMALVLLSVICVAIFFVISKDDTTKSSQDAGTTSSGELTSLDKNVDSTPCFSFDPGFDYKTADTGSDCEILVREEGGGLDIGISVDTNTHAGIDASTDLEFYTKTVESYKSSTKTISSRELTVDNKPATEVTRDNGDGTIRARTIVYNDNPEYTDGDVKVAVFLIQTQYNTGEDNYIDAHRQLVDSIAWK